MKRLLPYALVTILLTTIVGCSSEQTTQETTNELTPVTVVLDYIPNTNHTGLYVALENGYFEEVGLNVTIIEPTQGASETLVALGQADFGISYQENVTVAKTSEDPLPLKAIATIIQHNTSGFATYGENNITSPKDFEGLTYAGWGSPAEAAVLEAVMTKHGADFNELEMVISDGSGFEALKDTVDIMWFFEGWDNVKASMANFDINYMELSALDERLDYYTPIIITSDAIIEQSPEMIKSFLSATEKGYLYTIENPSEAANILHKYASAYSIEMLTLSLEYLQDKYMEDSEKWGTMKAEVWNNYTDFLLEYGIISSTIDAEDCFTNEFLPQ